MKEFHLHLVSDSTGETARTVVRASLAQFDNVRTVEHVWTMVRDQGQVEEMIAGIKAHPGMVLFTIIDPGIRDAVEDGCRALKVPYVSILDPVIGALAGYLGAEIAAKPGRQHVMNAEYFSRIEAIHFVLNHDDGRSTWDLEEADVVLLGVSRTSKTPTCIYLANQGIKAANIPIVPGVSLPSELMDTDKPLIVGLTKDPEALVQIRRTRLRMLKQDPQTDYVDIETVIEEVDEARRLFTRNDWPVIDVTRRSIEEVAATILQLHNRRQEQKL